MPTENRDGWNAWHWLSLAVAFYVIPCAIFLVYGNLYDSLPAGVKTFVDLLYWPVKQLFKVMGWLD